jgi:4-hydroxy-2-oxoglutarate aldolase
MSTQRPLLPAGIYTPLPTFFTPDEDLDLASLASHVLWTAQAGTFPVVTGSAGEAPHLTPAERSAIIRTARKSLDDNNLRHMPLVAGVGVPSTRETIALAHEAKDAGADYVMVIPPGYYAGALMADGGEALRRFFIDVADASPLPVILYNFPAVAGGIDIDAALVADVVRGSGNVVGVKLT